jgi:ribosome-binding protein aMBF1 (putative translation factor)
MTQKQFNAALEKLGFTQVGLAAKLEIGERSVRRWAAGQWPVPTPVAMLLNLMLKTSSTAEDLKA